jgi:MFS family permease
MSMPQVHIVAYCGDLGYGVARGADMLALMMAFGIVGRIGSGFIADRFGGLPTLMLGSALQGVALFLYLLYDGLISLYVISAVFGLFQGGIVPSYAIIVREYFPAKEAGARIGLILMASLFGMALGGWMSGYIFDLTVPTKRRSSTALAGTWSTGRSCCGCCSGGGAWALPMREAALSAAARHCLKGCARRRDRAREFP